jgi:hypothetical protein
MLTAYLRSWYYGVLLFVVVLLVFDYKTKAPDYDAARVALSQRLTFDEVMMVPGKFWDCGPTAWGYTYFAARLPDGGGLRDGVVCQYPRERQEVVFFDSLYAGSH